MDFGIQLVGGPCGQHGPYTFYKAFRYTKNGVKRVMTLSEFFFVKLWIDSDLVCIGELQLLWVDKNSEQVLASLRLYFLPENTPEGRMDHGEDEVLAISEKVVLRVEDLITWITIDTEWSWGRLGKTIENSSSTNATKTSEDAIPMSTNLGEGLLDLSDVEVEKKTTPSDSKYNDKMPSVVILSYPRYCRYRAMMMRLEGVEDVYLKMKIVNALGGFGVPSLNTRILFCRDTFDYPELEGHEMLCNHLAPKLKGRPRGRRKKRSISPGSESNESESSIYGVNNGQPSTSSGIKSTQLDEFMNDISISGSISTRRSKRTLEDRYERAFLKRIKEFMKSNQTPIGRIPSLGYRELDLYAFYTKVQKLGGYDSVTANRLWKSIFEDMGGNHTSTSAATVMRRHYERFLLPYERHSKGEKHKPLPVSARRRLKSKSNRTSTSDLDITSEGTSGSEHGMPLTPSIDNNLVGELKDVTSGLLEKGKTSSLRSVRVKSDRLKDGVKKENLVKDVDDIIGEEIKEVNEIDKIDKINEITKTNEISKINEMNKINEINKINDINKIIEIKEVEVKEVKEIKEIIEIKDIKEVEVINKVLVNKVIEKNVEPITTAATPAQIKIQDKSPSPVESKEIPIFEAPKNQLVEIIEIPAKIVAETPEIIDLDLESDVYKNISSNNINNNHSTNNNFSCNNNHSNINNLSIGNHTNNNNHSNNLHINSFHSKNIHPNNNNNNNIIGNVAPLIVEMDKKGAGGVEVLNDVKQQKLDILKQGGLEVTPVRKEIRPSVIQQAIAPNHRVEIIRNCSSTIMINNNNGNCASKALSDRKQMPPPMINPKRIEGGNGHGKERGIYQERRFVNGYNPPKVLQSKSIYIPSEKTVYGDPKDLFQPTIQQVQAPIFPEATRPTTGGGILDLTVKSPQKPTMDSAQIPYVPYGYLDNDLTSPAYARTPHHPLDGRKLNANLEITLVGKSIPPPLPLSNNHNQLGHTVFQKPSGLPRKRTISENFLTNSVKIPRADGIDRPRSAISVPKKDFEASIQYVAQTPSSGGISKEFVTPKDFGSKEFAFKDFVNSKDFISSKDFVPPSAARIPAPQPPLYHNGNQIMFPHMASAKMATPPMFVPDMNMMYQRMFNTYLPYRMPSSEYLQMYHEILNSRIRVPVQFPFAPETDSQKK